MAGLVPAIHVFAPARTGVSGEVVDARHEGGHDGVMESAGRL
jgi:hypothetical protein